MSRVHTILIVPERSSQVKRLQIPHRYIVMGTIAAVAMLTFSAVALVHYVYVVDQARNNRVLKDENVELKTHLHIMQDEVDRIDRSLRQNEQLASKVRSITQLNDPERNLAIGPIDDDGKLPKVAYVTGERVDDADEVIDSAVALQLIENRLDTLGRDVMVQDTNLREMTEYFAVNESVLANTPSIRPVRSRLVMSTFGERMNPYTGKMSMHKGVDFAAETGSDVVSTGAGTVIFVGYRGDYGKTVVIDHGHGFQTHYSHLSAYQVEVGAKVSRGDVIGAVGKTGRTTGVHLHYEARLNGIPQDPQKYILN